jgi:AcrR family transcriptional regulator
VPSNQPRKRPPTKSTPKKTTKTTNKASGKAAATSGMAQRRAGRRDAESRTSDERWQAITVAASTVFRRLGYQQATLEDVAKEVGINRATLYYYVADKAELLIAILDEPVHKMTVDLREIVTTDASAEQKLRLAIERHMQALDENYPELFVFLAENMHLLTIGRDRDIRRNAREYGALFTSIIVDGVASGEFRDDLDPRLVMLGIVGMMNWSHRWYNPAGRHSLQTIAKQFEELTLDGLLRRPTRRR